MKPILIIDDSENDALLLRDSLAQARVANPVQVVSDVTKAIAYLAGDAPFSDRNKFPMPVIIFVDLNIPIKDGFSFLQWKKNAKGHREIFTAILTGHEDAEAIRKASSLGVSAFLNKTYLSIDLDVLIRRFPQYWERTESHTNCGTVAGNRN
jgi:CheY-like chemotaxis protein